MIKEDFNIEAIQMGGTSCIGVKATHKTDPDINFWIWPAWFDAKVARQLAEWENSETPIPNWHVARLRLIQRGLIPELSTLVNLYQLRATRHAPAWETQTTARKEAVARFADTRRQLEQSFVKLPGSKIEMQETGFVWKFPHGTHRFTTEHAEKGCTPTYFGAEISVGGRVKELLTEADFKDAVAEFLSNRFTRFIRS